MKELSLTLKEKRWSSLIILLMYFVFGQYVISFIYSLFLKLLNIQMSIIEINSWFNLFYDAFMLLLATFLYRDYIKKSLQAIKGKYLRLTIWSITIGFIIIYFANVVSGVIVQLMSPGSTSANQDSLELMLKFCKFPILMTAIFIGPILEEFVFRVAIFRNIYDYNRILAYLCSGLCFGFVHIQQALFAGQLEQLFYLLPYGFLGIVFCYLYEKKGTLYVPIVVHIANNFVSMMISLSMI